MEETVESFYDYVVIRGSGAQEIEADSYNRIVFAKDISAAEIQITRDGLDLQLALSDMSASVRVLAWFSNPPNVPDVSLQFADDRTMDAQAITALALTQHGSEMSDQLTALD